MGSLLTAFAGLLVLAVGKATHGDLFPAAFAAGITVATFGPRRRASFEHFGALITPSLPHSSTDIVVARGFGDEHDVPTWFGRLRGRERTP
ncbi:hypothetical protein Ssi03_03520 [Sphaerisporangium siamense]|nr:hypothetical protein Ssi03_03520 [Sphaerisporangium siamense]